MPKNHYEILGLTRDATAEQIKKAYRKLARKYHPDVSKEPDAEARMQELNVAYDTLSDETKKAEYDFELDHPQGSHQFNPNAGFGGFEEAFRNAQGGQQAHDFSGFEDLF
ncbi:MAG: DnaJ domain-containing protein, partial [Proteobacteria bacterium]|nr:DnaJ domain-containing protein [Pseudomonadota bacterium]